LVKLVRKGNTTAIIYVLKSLRPEKWNDRNPRQKAATSGKIKDSHTITQEFRQALNNFQDTKKQIAI
jgi:hypothetical protein